jgi:hypothetical protein
MCVIVDVNVAAQVLLAPPDAAYRLLHRSLVLGKGYKATLAYGGHLTVEYGHHRRLFGLVAELDRAGRAKQYSDALIAAEAAAINEAGLLQSDDPHIVALAVVSGARVLCSDDGALCNDFKRQALVNHPRGKVYKNPTHQHLVRDNCAQ